MCSTVSARDRPLQVVPSPCHRENSKDVGARVVLEVDSGEVQSVERLEGVVVDEAQLLLADLDGLGPNGVAMETTWGDGIFPVVVHYGGRVTVEL